jgi:hypothetical protein
MSFNSTYIILYENINYFFFTISNHESSSVEGKQVLINIGMNDVVVVKIPLFPFVLMHCAYCIANTHFSIKNGVGLSIIILKTEIK